MDIDVQLPMVLVLVILGAVLIVGGIVAYRRSARTGVRALSAAAMAGGVAMWAVVLITIPTSSTSDGPQEPTVVVGLVSPTLTEKSFMTLLTVEDIHKLLATEISLDVEIRDFKAMAEGVDTAQAANMDSWYGLTVEAADGTGGMTFTVIDFDSPLSAQDHFEKMRSESEGSLQEMAQPIGDASLQAEVNAEGIGSMVVVAKGDKVISLHTAQSDGQRPLVSHDGLVELAELVANRL